MFANRITAATVRFSGGTVIEQEYPVLVHGEFYAQAAHPLKEELAGVEIAVAPVDDHAISGWGWMFAAARNRQTLGTLLSYFVSLLLPVLGAVSVLLFVGLSIKRGARAHTGLIPINVNLAGAVLVALALVWFHQYDFNAQLLPLSGGALAPRVGYWGAVIGALAQFVALAAMTRLTVRKVTSWWLLVGIVALSIWLLARFQPYPYLEIWNFVSDGILVTLRIVVTSFGFILLVSLLGGLGRISRSKIIYGIASLYVELVRGIPLLVQMLFIWYALPQVFKSIGAMLQSASPGLMDAGQWFLDLRLSAFTAAVVGLTVCYGALWLRDLSRGHLFHSPRADGGGAFAGHDLLPGHALRGAAAGRARDPATHRQRVRGPAQGFLAGFGARRGRPDAARTRVHGAHLYEL